MAYNCYLFDELMPVTPGELSIKIKGKNSALTLLNEGEINLLKLPGLSEINFSLMFPMLTGVHPPEYYLALLEKAKADRSSTQFILTRTSPDGRLLFDTNIKVSVEDYNISESAGNGFDVTCDIKLKQYRDYGTKTVTVESVTASGSSSGGSSGGQNSGSIVAGDTVLIVEGAVYGSQAMHLRGMKVPVCYTNKWYTVTKVQTNVGTEEALIKELFSWVALSYLRKQGVSATSDGGTEIITITEERDASSAPHAISHIVKPGETLWSIARYYYGDGALYPRIHEANIDVVGDPNTIHSGLVLTIP